MRGQVRAPRARAFSLGSIISSRDVVNSQDFGMLRRSENSLLRMFSLVRQLHDHPEEYRLALAIQEELIVRKSNVERRIRVLRQHRRALSFELSKRHSDRGRANELKSAIARIDDRIQEARLLDSVYLDIGDAVAFTYIDPWDIKPLVFRERAGFISGKKGARLERKVLREVYRVGGIAILNDLTHSLRYADLTVIHKPKTNFLLMELKSGRGGSRVRAHRQLKAAERVTNYLKTDKVQDLYAPGQEMLHYSVHSAPVYNADAINRMLAKTTMDSLVREEVEAGLHYIAIVGDWSEDTDTILGAYSAKHLVMLVNDFKGSKVGYRPFLLNLEDPNKMLQFYQGSIVIIVIIDTESVKERLRQRGLDLHLTGNDEWPWEISSSPDENRSRFSWHFISRVGAEFLSLNWLVDELSQPIDPMKLPS